MNTLWVDLKTLRLNDTAGAGSTGLESHMREKHQFFPRNRFFQPCIAHPAPQNRSKTAPTLGEKSVSVWPFCVQCRPRSWKHSYHPKSELAEAAFCLTQRDRWLEKMKEEQIN